MDKSQLIWRGQHYPETIKTIKKKNKAKKIKTEERKKERKKLQTNSSHNIGWGNPQQTQLNLIRLNCEAFTPAV